MLTKLKDSFSQLQQLTAYLDEVESKQKIKEENNTNQKNQTTTIEIIEDSAAPASSPAPESKESESKEPEEQVAAAAAEGKEDKEEDSPIAFLEANHLRCADLPFTIDEFKKAKKEAEAEAEAEAEEEAVTVNITSIPVALMDLKPAEVMTTAAAIVSSLLETQHPVLPGEAVRMKNEKSYVSIYRKSASEVLFTWISYPTEKEIAAAANQIQSQTQGKQPPYTVLIDQGIQVASLIFKCTKSDDTELTFEFNSESVEGWSADISSAVTNMVGRFFTSKKRNQGGQLVGKKAYMNLTRMSDDEVLFTWVTYPRA